MALPSSEDVSQQDATPAGLPRGELLIGYREGVAIVSLVGEHDLETAAKLQRSLGARVERGQGVVVSLVDATFVDSSIVHVLLQADADMIARSGRRLVLHSTIDSKVDLVLVLSGLATRLLCDDSLDQAVELAVQCYPE